MLSKQARAHRKYGVVKKISHSEASALADELKQFLRLQPLKDNPRRRHSIIVVGGVRRKEPVSKDVDLLVIVPDKKTAIAKTFTRVALAKKSGMEIICSYTAGERRHSLIVRRRGKHFAVDLFLATESEKPFALLHHTGPKDYNIRIRAHAKRNGLTLNQYGVFSSATRYRARGSSAIKTEKDLAKFLGITYRPPEKRSVTASKK